MLSNMKKYLLFLPITTKFCYYKVINQVICIRPVTGPRFAVLLKQQPPQFWPAFEWTNAFSRMK